MNATKSLPDFVKPMLAKTGDPFDSDEHLFEIKWDGIRALVFVDEGGYRMMSRREFDITSRYPEFRCLAELPSGTILDGEIVVLNEAGKPDFSAVLSREQARTPRRFQTLAQAAPATFVVFDQLYQQYQPITALPLSERREQVLRTLAPLDTDRLVASDGVVGPGAEFFRQIVARGMEGVVAKRLSGRYFPGKRTDAWIKVRKSSTVLCAIIGYVPDGDDFESLIIATDDDGELRYVGRVGNGFDAAKRTSVNKLLRSHASSTPLISCKEKGSWLEPGLYCSVRYFEKTKDGILREAVFEQLITN